MRIAAPVIVAAAVLAAACGGRIFGSSPEARAAAPVTVGEYNAIEKRIAERFPALRKHLAAGQLEPAAGEAQQLASAFGESERFWAQQRETAAVELAARGRELATEAAAMAALGDGERLTRAVDAMERTCARCHTAYREDDPAGGFRIKQAARPR